MLNSYYFCTFLYGYRKNQENILLFVCNMIKYLQTKEEIMNKNDKYRVDIEKLRTLNLYQLREVGSKIGVRNPTALKAERLRQAIVDVVTGKVEPYLKIKSGRPHKKEIIPDSEWNKLVGFEAFSKTTGALYSTEGSKLKEVRENIYTGFVKYIGDTLYFFPTSSQSLDINVYAIIEENTLHFENLRNGDKIKCGIDFQERTPRVLEIYEINDCPPTLTRQDFAQMEISPISNTIEFTLPQLKFINKVCPFKIGQRLMIVGENGAGQTYLCNSIAKDLDERYKVVYFSVCKRPEEKILLKNCEYFFTTFDTLPADINFYFEIILDRIKRICELGNNVVLIIDDITTLMTNLRDLLSDRCPAKSYDDEILQQLKRLFAYSRNTNNGSLSIICSGYTNCTDEKLRDYLDILDKLCNCHIKLIRQNYIQGKPEFYDESQTFAEVIRQV